MSTTMIFIAAVVLLVLTPIVSLLATAVTLIITILFLVSRDKIVVVPTVTHEEDPLAASVVISAVLAPMFGVAWGYAQINGWTAHRNPFDQYRLTIDQLWLRKVANVESTIKPGWPMLIGTPTSAASTGIVIVVATISARVNKRFMVNFLWLKILGRRNSENGLRDTLK